MYCILYPRRHSILNVFGCILPDLSLNYFLKIEDTILSSVETCRDFELLYRSSLSTRLCIILCLLRTKIIPNIIGSPIKHIFLLKRKIISIITDKWLIIANNRKTKSHNVSDRNIIVYTFRF